MNGTSKAPSSLEDTTIERMPEEELKLDEYLSILKKRWLWIAVNIVLFSAGGFFYTSSQIKVYQATASIAVTPPQSKKIGEIEVERTLTARESFMLTQQAILKSRTIAKKVLAKIPDSIRQEFFAETNARPESKLVDSLDVQVQKNTDIILVTFRGTSPEYCATIANLVVEAFIEENDQQNNTQTLILQWLKQEIPGIEQKMIKTRDAILKFEEENLDILLASKNHDQFYTDIMEQSNQELQKIKVQLLGMDADYKKCVETRQMGGLERVLALSFFEESPLFQRLRQQKADMENLMAEYQLKYTSKHPKMMWLMQNIEKQDKKIWQEAELFLQRQEERYKDLQRKKESLEKVVQEQLAQSVKLKQKYMEYDRFRREYESLQKAYNSLVEKMKELDLTSTYRMGNIRKVDPAEIPLYPFKPNKRANYLLSFFLGCCVGIGLAFLLEMFDTKARNIDEIQHIIHAPLFGCVPAISSAEFKNIALAVKQKETSEVTEAFQNISTSLLFTGDEKIGNPVLFSSAMPEDGKTTTVCNLGLTISKAGYNVLIIDGDLRKAQIHKKFDLKESEGLYEVLKGKISLENAIVPVSENLSCLPAGNCPSNPYGLFISSRLDDLWPKLEKKYQYILFDAPPLLVVPETLIFAKAIKKLVLVVSDYHAYKKMLQDIVHRLDALDVHINGLIINNIKGNMLTYHKHHYYNYYSYKPYGIKPKAQ